MNRTYLFSIRAIFVVAILALISIATSHTASAQDPRTFDVKAVSASDNNAAGEFPLTYTINYDNGTQQTISLAGEGVAKVVTPGGAVNPVSIIFLGQTWVINSNSVLCFPPSPNGGCWCLCLQWVRVWPWLVYPRWFWYYNPCC